MKPKLDSRNLDKKDVMMETGVMNAGFVVKESNVFDKAYMFSVQGWYRDKRCHQCHTVQSHSLESLIVGKLWKVRMILQC